LANGGQLRAVEQKACFFITVAIGRAVGPSAKGDAA
jgi:hypothetical protein